MTLINLPFQKKFKLNLNLILNQNGVPCNYPLFFCNINRDSLDIYNTTFLGHIYFDTISQTFPLNNSINKYSIFNQVKRSD